LLPRKYLPLFDRVIIPPGVTPPDFFIDKKSGRRFRLRKKEVN
jgi:hypothetical protein